MRDKITETRKEKDKLVAKATAKGHKTGEHLFNYLSEVDMHKYDVLMRQEVKEQTMNEVIEELMKPTRLEVISQGIKRHCTLWNYKILDFSLQDEGKTLKIFVNEMKK